MAKLLATEAEMKLEKVGFIVNRLGFIKSKKEVPTLLEVRWRNSPQDDVVFLKIINGLVDMDDFMEVMKSLEPHMLEMKPLERYSYSLIVY